jgi:hypothetical protein
VTELHGLTRGTVAVEIDQDDLGGQTAQAACRGGRGNLTGADDRYSSRQGSARRANGRRRGVRRCCVLHC